jgi:hypothetical protein
MRRPRLEDAGDGVDDIVRQFREFTTTRQDVFVRADERAECTVRLKFYPIQDRRPKLS